jgi:hypothetical protein
MAPVAAGRRDRHADRGREPRRRARQLADPRTRGMRLPVRRLDVAAAPGLTNGTKAPPRSTCRPMAGPGDQAAPCRTVALSAGRLHDPDRGVGAADPSLPGGPGCPRLAEATGTRSPALLLRAWATPTHASVGSRGPEAVARTIRRSPSRQRTAHDVRSRPGGRRSWGSPSETPPAQRAYGWRGPVGEQPPNAALGRTSASAHGIVRRGHLPSLCPGRRASAAVT